jgi:hypothetical protein
MINPFFKGQKCHMFPVFSPFCPYESCIWRILKVLQPKNFLP